MGQPPSYANSITPAPLASGTTDNYNPAGYTPGVTNRLILTPASGGSTLAGLVASTFNGWAVMLVNTSTTDSITFTHQSSGTSANQFSCPQGVSAILAPLTNVVIIYTVNQWCFV